MTTSNETSNERKSHMGTGSLRRVGAVGVAIAAFGLQAATAAAQPSTMMQQGRLFAEATGDPVDGTKSVTFSIYDAENAPTPLWSEAHVLSFDDGHFHAELGGATPFGSIFELAPGEERWIGVVVDDEELLPRQKVGSVPFAAVAQNAIGDLTPKSVAISGYGPVIDGLGRWVGSPVAVAAGGGTSTALAFSANSTTWVGNTLATYGNTLLAVVPENSVFVTVSALLRRTDGGGTLAYGYLAPCAMPVGGGTPVVPLLARTTYFEFTTGSSWERQFVSSFTFTDLPADSYYFTICGRSFTNVTIGFYGPQARTIRF